MTLHVVWCLHRDNSLYREPLIRTHLFDLLSDPQKSKKTKMNKAEENKNKSFMRKMYDFVLEPPHLSHLKVCVAAVLLAVFTIGFYVLCRKRKRRNDFVHNEEDCFSDFMMMQQTKSEIPDTDRPPDIKPTSLATTHQIKKFFKQDLQPLMQKVQKNLGDIRASLTSNQTQPTLDVV